MCLLQDENGNEALGVLGAFFCWVLLNHWNVCCRVSGCNCTKSHQGCSRTNKIKPSNNGRVALLRWRIRRSHLFPLLYYTRNVERSRSYLPIHSTRGDIWSIYVQVHCLFWTTHKLNNRVLIIKRPKRHAVTRCRVQLHDITNLLVQLSFCPVYIIHQ